jgi:hypothetical protein
MSDWRAVLKSDPTEWLLEEDNPSVRYFTLRDILDRPDDDRMVQSARREIMHRGIVPDILEKQLSPEYLAAYPRFYTDKYEGLVWSLIVLADLGADTTPQIRAQCEYLLTNSQETQDGGFSMHTAQRTGGGRITEVVPCLTGNMVWSLIRFGYLDDPRLQKAIAWMTRCARFNDGVEETPQIPPYDRFEMCWGSHVCHMGVVKMLKALSAMPEAQRTVGDVGQTIRQATEFLLIHHIYKRSHDLRRTSKPGWLKFGFPLMYQTDVLEILDVLTGLGVHDSRMNDAVDIVLAKQDGMGRWRAENTFGSDRLLVPIGQKGEESKWITLRAVRVLKRYQQ